MNVKKKKEFEPYIDKDGDLISGYISKINVFGTTYALRCEIIETHPIICPKCGGSFELKYGHGKCDYCGTYYSTNFMLEEVK